MTDALSALNQAGLSIWLDDLSRERLRAGSIASLRGRAAIASARLGSCAQLSEHLAETLRARPIQNRS